MAHSIMVVRQVLVLFVEVRILVGQQIKKAPEFRGFFLFTGPLKSFNNQPIQMTFSRMIKGSFIATFAFAIKIISYEKVTGCSITVFCLLRH